MAWFLVYLPIQVTSLLYLCFQATTDGNTVMCVRDFGYKPTPEAKSSFVARSLVGQECFEELFFPCRKAEITDSAQDESSGGDPFVFE